MWPDPADTVEMKQNEMREAELRKEYWAEMIGKGSRVERFTNTRESARRIIDSIITAESKTQWCRIQQELVDQGKTLSATDAGKELFYAYYEDMVARQNALMQQLTAEMEKAAADPVTIMALREQLRDELVKRKNARKEMRKLESSGKKGVPTCSYLIFTAWEGDADLIFQGLSTPPDLNIVFRLNS
ncbi:hypothetical protein Agabi119p4_9706 [Agaricus bisporus var. burnettii]|uniref:Uncharacterized protein n=1 Tax=Agaricus bisporus var. burnettii TaxID=192524 RepID=A0A8H7C2X7_AGABI|nr:hypothetical protein Agabi119p4_9706 [Agaricus bisporus var. burnettii]